MIFCLDNWIRLKGDFCKFIVVAKDLIKDCQALHESAENAQAGNNLAEQEAVNRLMMALNSELTPALLTDRLLHHH